MRHDINYSSVIAMTKRQPSGNLLVATEHQQGTTMRTQPIAAIAVLGLGLGLAAATAVAGANDYTFEAVQADVKAGAGRDIAVRLVHKPGGPPVPGAVIFQTRLDMAPDGMADMTSTINPAQSSEPGVYRFKADFTMAGRWALTLAAKVQGEAETVKGTVVLQAKD